MLRGLVGSQACVIAAVYALAHGLMLVDDGLFWDDWCIIGVDRHQLGEHLRQMGVPLLSELHLAMTALPCTATAYRLAAFASYLVAALALLGVLRTIPSIDARTRLGICLVFAVLPVNAARESACCLHYAVCYALWFIGAWLLARSLAGSPRWMRVLCWACLVLSWSTTSLLAFQPLLLLYAWLARRARDPLRPSLVQSAQMNLDLILLPVAYLAVRAICFQPFGEFSGYNRITVHGLTDPTVLSVFLDAITCDGDFLVRRVACVCALAVGLVALAALARRRPLTRPSSWRCDLTWCGLGALALLLAIYPYTVVGKPPGPSDWHSRFQLLYPLGIAFMICLSLKLILDAARAPDAWRVWMHAIVLTPMLAFCVADHLAFQRDWHKQLAIVSCFARSEAMREHTTFQFSDQANAFNANWREYRFYEYTGMMKRAFGDQSRYGDAGGTQEDHLSQFTYPSVFSIADYRPGAIDCQVAILPVGSVPPLTRTLAMAWWKLVDSGRFAREVDGMIMLTCKPVRPASP